MTSENHPESNENQKWDQCPAGELSQLNQQLKSREARSLSERRLVAAGVFIVLLSPIFLWSINSLQPGADSVADISCEEVETHLVSFSNEELDEELMQRIQHHLVICPKCKEHFEELTQENNPQKISSFIENHFHPEKDSHDEHDYLSAIALHR